MLTLLLAFTASAHDYWLFPETFEPAPSTTMRMLLLVGDDLHIEQIRPFEKERATRLERWNAQGRTDLLAGHPRRANPAIQAPAPAEPGQALIAFDRAPAEVVLDADAFVAHLEAEGLTHLVHQHDGHPHVHGAQTDTFDRSIKTLVAVGGDTSGDAWGQVVGQKLELVLQRDPFAGPGPLAVRLLEDGAPVKRVKVEAIQRQGQKDDPEIHEARTDRDGVAQFELTEGRWVLRATTAEPDGKNAWASHWTAFSIFVPGA